MSQSGFDAVFAAGRDALLAGTHRVEGDPSITGRWGPSLVFLPSGGVAEALDRLTTQIASVIGAHHWMSGGLGRAHLTVRALEPHAESIPADRVRRYVAATGRALARVGPVRLNFVGLGVAAGGVMACAIPEDACAHDLRQVVGDELGRDGWLEDEVLPNGRDPIWYCSLVHFAGPVTAVADLLEWVEAHRQVSLGAQAYDAVALCLWEYDGAAMRPLTVETAGRRGAGAQTEGLTGAGDGASAGGWRRPKSP